MPISSWLIGVFQPSGETFDTFVPAGIEGTMAVSPTTDRYYLDDSLGARSFLTFLAARILSSNADIGTCSIVLLENRRIRITFDVQTDVAWGAATDVRDALGFDADLSGGLTYTAPGVSPFLWVPGLTEVGDMRLGRPGVPVYDTQVGGGGSFTRPVFTTSSYRVPAKLAWMHVANSRVWVDESGGEYFAFWRSVLLVGEQCAHYRQVNNDESSTAPVTLANRVGPYCWDPPPGETRFPYERATPNVETRNHVRVPLVQVTEI